MTSQSVARRASGLDYIQYELMECRIMYLIKSRYVLVNHSVLLGRLSGWSYDEIMRSVWPTRAGANNAYVEELADLVAPQVMRLLQPLKISKAVA